MTNNSFLGLFRLRRFYRKTRTNILILNEKGIISLWWIGFFILLLTFTTLMIYLIWVSVFPRNSGFEHFPIPLLPDTDIHNRTHIHFSTVVCSLVRVDKTMKMIKDIVELEKFDTEKHKIGLHFHIWSFKNILKFITCTFIQSSNT